MLFDRMVDNWRLRIECREDQESMAMGILDIFEKCHGSGKPLAPGFRVRFGWSMLQLVQEGNSLRVSEPDFSRWPEPLWSPSVEITLRVQSDQIRWLHDIGTEGEDAYFDQMILAARGALGESEVFLKRASSHSVQDSGWLVAPIADPEALSQGEDLEPIAIASLWTLRPALLQVMALPRGYISIFEGAKVKQILAPSGRSLLPH